MSEDTAVLEKAVRLGYDPDRYEQDDPKWKSPEEFIAFGEQLNPILRENNKRLEAQNSELREEITKIQIEVAKFAKLHEETSKAAYAQARADLKAEKAEALSTGDYEAVVEIDEKLEATREAEKQADAEAAAKKAEKPAPKTPEVDPETAKQFAAWEAKNPWTQNKEAEAFARSVGILMAQEGQPHTGDDFVPFLNKLTKKVKERFPELFEDSPRERDSLVEGGGDGGEYVPKGKKTYANLPKEAREACDLLVATVKGYTREKYVQAYKW